MQKSHFRINSSLRISHTHRPQRNFGSGMRTVRPAQLVVPVAEEYRSRVWNHDKADQRLKIQHLEATNCNNRKEPKQRFKYSISKRLIVTIVRNRSNNLKFGQQKLKSIQPRYDDGNRSYRSPRMRRNENCETTTTTTSCVDHYRTKTKRKFINF